jgi:hypothetical protein
MTSADMTSTRRPAETIEEVLAALRAVVDDAVVAGSRTGFFAALYRGVTAAVARGIEAGVFDDGERMSRFDAEFGNRYLDALAAWRAGAEPSRAWRAAFRAADRDGPVIAQHLMLGVNAHINLDLPLAAAEVAPGDEIWELRADFDRVNGILIAVLHDVQVALAELSPLMGALDEVLGRLDEEIIGFDIRRARTEAWLAAVLLSAQPPQAQAVTEQLLDRSTTGLARGILSPPFPVPAALEVVRFTERTPVPDAIRRLDRSAVA